MCQTDFCAETGSRHECVPGSPAGWGRQSSRDPSVAAGGQGDPRRRAQIDLAFRRRARASRPWLSRGWSATAITGSAARGVSGGHEDRRRHAVPLGNAGEGPGAQGGPETAGHQRLHQRVRSAPAMASGPITGKATAPRFVYVNDHRLESALSAAVNGTDRARRRRRKDHAGSLSSRELALLHPVPFLDRHGGFHSDEVGPGRHLARRPCASGLVRGCP